jgi:hypothetical protein
MPEAVQAAGQRQEELDVAQLRRLSFLKFEKELN